MRVYRTGSREANIRLHVQPGNEFKNSDFVDAQGNAIQFTVQFQAGEAKVPSNLGKYLIDKGLAQRSPLILPQGVAA
jgi:hypothetical protein